VGHRALIAYRRPDGLYNCHYSHWGGLKLRLKHSITSETPFGGEASDSDVQAHFRSSLRATEVDQLEPPTAPSAGVDLEPFEVGVTLGSIIEQRLDFLSHEAFYVVEEDFDVTAYRTLWFGLQHESRTIEEGATIGNGALATVRWYDGEPVGDGAFCGRFGATTIHKRIKKPPVSGGTDGSSGVTTVVKRSEKGGVSGGKTRFRCVPAARGPSNTCPYRDATHTRSPS